MIIAVENTLISSEIFSKITDYSLYKFSILMFTMKNVLNIFCIYKLPTNMQRRQKKVSNLTIISKL